MNRPASKSGSIMVMTAFLSVFLIGMVAIGVDIGYVYHERNALQTSVDAAWKAGFDRMMKFKSDSPILSSGDKNSIKLQIKEILKLNGRPSIVAENATIDINSPKNELTVKATQDVQLFFAQILDIKTMKVAAARSNAGSGVEDIAAGIIPLAIPHGITFDSVSTYSCKLFKVGEGFELGKQYVIKLGEADDNAIDIPQDETLKMILIPMDAYGQSKKPTSSKGSSHHHHYDDDDDDEDEEDSDDSPYLRAYGAVYWCLQTGEENDIGFTPVYWVLGYKGGSFLLPYCQEVMDMLSSQQYRVNYEILHYAELKSIFDAIDKGTYEILELYKRPRIAVYSSQTGVDPVERILQHSNIPYGPYCLPETPDFFKRGKFDVNKCKAFYDSDIMKNSLDRYNWLHLHHEDFTGCNGGCLNRYDDYPEGHYRNCLYSIYDDRAAQGFRTEQDARAALNDFIRNAELYMCSSCLDIVKKTSKVVSYKSREGISSQNSVVRYKYVINPSSSSSSRKRGSSKNSYNSNLSSKYCKFAERVRCGDRVGVGGGRWINKPEYLCSECNNPDLCNLAQSLGYTDDKNIDNKFFSDLNTHPLNWFGNGHATSWQKMRWDMVAKIRNHVVNGGYLYAQCFAPETLDIALWQRGVYERSGGKLKEPAADKLVLGSDYDYCMAFHNMRYNQYPKYSHSRCPYSSIHATDVRGTFNLDPKYRLAAECQNHANNPSVGAGSTCAFYNNTIKPGIRIFGYVPGKSYCRYLGGDLGKGKFIFMGGHEHENIPSRRLVLNNVLLGSLAEKIIEGKTPTGEGKIKYNYGRIDPDNIRNNYNDPNEKNQAIEDYLNRIRFGFSQTINLNDRLITESGNLGSETEQLLDEYASGTIVIVPITDIGTEAGEFSTEAAGTTIYDLMDTDEIDLNGKYDKDPSLSGKKVPIRVIGFAKFQIIHPSCYSQVEQPAGSNLGHHILGQLRGKFLGYMVTPTEAEESKVLD